MLAQINRNVRRKELFLLLCFTSMVSSFIFTAIISIYQLINPINTGVFRTWNNQRSTVLRTSQRSFPSNYITYFFNNNTFPSLKTRYLKSVFFSELLSQGSIEQTRVQQISVCEYLRTWKIGGRTKILCTLSYTWHSNVILFICHWIFIMLWSKQAKSKLHKVKVNHW